MKLTTTPVFGLGLMALALFSSCGERGDANREDLSAAGYEVTQEEFFRAAESDDVRAMKRMLEAGLALDSMDVKGRTALHAAAGSGAMQSINFMLDRRMDIDIADADGRTPLMEAVLRSTPETVRYLLRQGANPSLKDAERFKPLMLAVRDARSNVVPELAPYVREDLDDALLAAAILGQAEVIDELTNFGASIYARIDDGRTPLMLAAQNGHASAVDMLLAIGANRFAMDDKGMMAADHAGESGHDLLAERLAAAPKEGDFELSEPAELGAEMAAVVEKQVAEALAMNGEDEGTGEVGPAGEEGSDPRIEPIPGEAGGALGNLPQQPRGGTVDPLEGAVVTAVEAGMEPGSLLPAGPGDERPDAMVMRSYRQRELPLRVDSAERGVATMRLAGGEPMKIGEGSSVPGTSLKVIRIHSRMQSTKEGEVEVSVVEVEDTKNGVVRDLVVDLPALAHDPVALVEDSASGRYYVARTGQRFKSVDGTDWLVGDVRPNQVVIENMKTRETTTIPLRGPRG